MTSIAQPSPRFSRRTPARPPPRRGCTTISSPLDAAPSPTFVRPSARAGVKPSETMPGEEWNWPRSIIRYGAVAAPSSSSRIAAARPPRLRTSSPTRPAGNSRPVAAERNATLLDQDDVALIDTRRHAAWMPRLRETYSQRPFLWTSRYLPRQAVSGAPVKARSAGPAARWDCRSSAAGFGPARPRSSRPRAPCPGPAGPP